MSQYHEEKLLEDADVSKYDHHSSSQYVDAVEVKHTNEMNFVWAKNHPYLFVINVEIFQNDYPVELWDHSIDMSRKGFITFIATKK